MKKILSIALLLSGIAHATEKKVETVAKKIGAPAPVTVKKEDKENTPHTTDKEGKSTSLSHATNGEFTEFDATKQPKEIPAPHFNLPPHFGMGLTFPTPKEQADTATILTSFSPLNVIGKLHTLTKTHLKENPELEKAVDMFKEEVVTSLKNLRKPLMNSIRTIKMEEFFMDADVMRSAQAILFGFGQLINTLQQEPQKPFGPKEDDKLKDVFKNVVQHVTAIALKANEHIAKSEKGDTQKEPKKAVMEHVTAQAKTVVPPIKHEDVTHHEEHTETAKVVAKK